MFPPGRARLATKPVPTGSPGDYDDRNFARRVLRHQRAGCENRRDNVDLETNQVRRQIGKQVGVPRFAERISNAKFCPSK